MPLHTWVCRVAAYLVAQRSGRSPAPDSTLIAPYGGGRFERIGLRRGAGLLMMRIGAKREVRCGSGWCDLLSNHEIVEVKECRHWRHALGQVLAYGTFWPDQQQRIHLFDIESAHLAECVRVRAVFDVIISVAQLR